MNNFNHRAVLVCAYNIRTDKYHYAKFLVQHGYDCNLPAEEFIDEVRGDLWATYDFGRCPLTIAGAKQDFQQYVQYRLNHHVDVDALRELRVKRKQMREVAI